ncbi:hypothetical protein M670_01010 [Schinkia azotoformans MEV2011]|uniref:Uncharacterized protein n=1 Tax=Schinkia azotoformans MEV2011 TaxID=1348973 RepID=A0A072NR79_SCHAZ|nr:hypothetical protein [Schinkia azotoformans]KEF39986.1 hypothetical protein M670_01010 [Schinkia azotoformans MEV2011]MEC1697284.1 hypothetical protein [Schinkia azotoformans]MEC1724323.1 hypothetical protein [Schinkia azotoformans]MEC1771526.1 hypothetical protein [Schinkia azotoformans]MED4367671.1 hypothetical protein [Schinkia azotoformans]
MLKIRGKIRGSDTFAEIQLDKGQLDGDVELILLIMRLSAEWEAYGTIPPLHYTPKVDVYWKDEFTLLFMMEEIFTEVQANKKVKIPFPEVEEGKDY